MSIIEELAEIKCARMAAGEAQYDMMIELTDSQKQRLKTWAKETYRLGRKGERIQIFSYECGMICGMKYTP